MKFGNVGVIAFIIDWGILNILVGAFHMHNVLAATISFIISLIFNYVASMKMVFKHREDMARWMEIVIFVVGAEIGLFMNDAIIWISTYGMNHDAYVSQSTEYLIRTNVGKLIATAVVMVWNFLTRKWLLDDTHTNAMNRLKKQENRLTPEELEAKWERSVPHKLGVSALEHTPMGWPKKLPIIGLTKSASEPIAIRTRFSLCGLSAVPAGYPSASGTCSVTRSRW